MVRVVGLLVLIGVSCIARPALAQTQEVCLLPPGTTPPEDPPVTAQQVEDGSAWSSNIINCRRTDRVESVMATSSERLTFVSSQAMLIGKLL